MPLLCQKHNSHSPFRKVVKGSPVCMHPLRFLHSSATTHQTFIFIRFLTIANTGREILREAQYVDGEVHGVGEELMHLADDIDDTIIEAQVRSSNVTLPSPLCAPATVCSRSIATTWLFRTFRVEGSCFDAQRAAHPWTEYHRSHSHLLPPSATHCRIFARFHITFFLTPTRFRRESFGRGTTALYALYTSVAARTGRSSAWGYRPSCPRRSTWIITGTKCGSATLIW